MLDYILKRLLFMIITLVVISIISFVIIQLPPGDYLTSYIMLMEEQGSAVDEAEIAALRKQYGLDQPFYVQYLMWMWSILHGDFGYSFEWEKPVNESLPTTGPLLLRALQSQDMYLAGSFVLILSLLTVVGTLISDIMLVWFDPRIRFGRK